MAMAGNMSIEVPKTAPSGVVIGGRASPLDYLFFMRPVLLPPVWTIAILGANAAPFDGLSQSLWRTVVFAVHLSALFGAVYTFNQIHDVESDRRNQKLFFLPEGLISLLAARRFTVALNIAALLFTVVLASTGHGGGFDFEFLGLTLAIMLLGIVYSAGRRPWKNSPLLGFLANVIAHGAVVYLLGVAFAGSPNGPQLELVAGYVLAVGAVYLATTVADAQGDQATGKRTLAVAIGARASMWMASVLVLLAIWIAWSGSDWLLLTGGIIAIPFYLQSAFRPTARRAARAAKAAVAALSALACLVYPPYLVLLVVGFTGTRLFFHWRFKMTYPTLT